MNERIKALFELKIPSKYQEVIESNLKLMDENLDEFSLIREDLLASLSSQADIFFNNFSFELLQTENFFDESILILLNRAFLELIFKSITYKDPPKKEEVPAPVIQPENIEEKKENEEQQNEQITPVENSQPLPEEEKKEEEIPNKVYPPRPEPTQQDFDMLKARGKLKFSFENFENEREEEVKYNALIRVHIPLNYNAPKEEENKENIENNNEENTNIEKKEEILNDLKEEPAINVNEESFIEPYDGTSFQKLREQYYGKSRSILNIFKINIWSPLNIFFLILF